MEERIHELEDRNRNKTGRREKINFFNEEIIRELFNSFS